MNCFNPNSPLFACDTEATGLDIWHGCRPFFVAICDAEMGHIFWEADVCPFTRIPSFPENFYEEFLDVWNRNSRFLFHNLKFDLRALSTEFDNLDHKTVFDFCEDTVVLSHAIDNLESHKLKDLATRYCYYPKDDQDALREAVNSARRKARSKQFVKEFGEVDLARPKHPHFPAIKQRPDDGWWVMDMWLPRAVATILEYPDHHPWYTVVQDYCLSDVFRTMLVWVHLKGLAEHLDVWESYLMRRQLLRVTWMMEQRGASINEEILTTEIDRYSELSSDHAEQAKWISGIENLNSDNQIRKYLYEENKLFVPKTTETGLPSVDQDSLNTILEAVPSHHACEFITHYLKSKKATKAGDYLSSYFNFMTDGRIHNSINITGTAETRQSNNSPNLQNVGKGREQD